MRQVVLVVVNVIDGIYAVVVMLCYTNKLVVMCDDDMDADVGDLRLGEYK